MMEVFSPWDGKPKAGDPISTVSFAATARGGYYSESSMSVNVVVPAGRILVLTGLHVRNINGYTTYPYNYPSGSITMIQNSTAYATFNGHAAKHETTQGIVSASATGYQAAPATMSDSWQGMDVISGGASGVTLTLTVYANSYYTGATASIGGYLI
jgi:hypothetical protein